MEATTLSSGEAHAQKKQSDGRDITVSCQPSDSLELAIRDLWHLCDTAVCRVLLIMQWLEVYYSLPGGQDNLCRIFYRYFFEALHFLRFDRVGAQSAAKRRRSGSQASQIPSAPNHSAVPLRLVPETAVPLPSQPTAAEPPFFDETSLLFPPRLPGYHGFLRLFPITE